MNVAQAVAALDALDDGDSEAMHGKADDILLKYVPKPVREAYDRVVARANFWASA